MLGVRPHARSIYYFTAIPGLKPLRTDYPVTKDGGYTYARGGQRGVYVGSGRPLGALSASLMDQLGSLDVQRFQRFALLVGELGGLHDPAPGALVGHHL